MRTTLHHSLALLSAIVGCHVDAPCESSLPVGAHLDVRVLEVTIAAAGAECDKVALLAQDQFRITTGKPFEGGPNNDCLSPSAEGPPPLAASLTISACRPGNLLGTECDVVRSDCEVPARLDVELIGPDDFDVGQSREMLYRVSLQHAKGECPLIACSSEYRVQVTRVD